MARRSKPPHRPKPPADTRFKPGQSGNPAAGPYKVKWEKELARRELTGATGPDPLPHPDHIVIDMNTGGVIIRGPMTKEDKAKFAERKAECDRTIVELEQQLRDDPDYEYKDQVLDEIAHERKIREIIERVMPD